MQVETKMGFKNPDTRCYRNSIFQMLAHAPVILHWVEWYRFQHVPQNRVCQFGQNEGRCKVCLLYDLLLTFWDSDAGDCEATLAELWDRVFPDLNGGTMTGEQDAAEFWAELYRQLSEDTRPIL